MPFSSEDNPNNQNALADLCSAIIIPPSCILPHPATAAASDTAVNFESRRLPAASALHLLALPAEILLTILSELTITSRVHLALTCKEFARVLGGMPNILTLDLPVNRATLKLFQRDESFQCWSLASFNFRMQRIRPGLHIIRVYDGTRYTLTCKCGKMISSHNLWLLKETHPETFKEDHRESKLWFCGYVLKHMREHVLSGVGGRIVTDGMFELMATEYVKGLIGRMNLKYTKAAVLAWAVSWNAEREDEDTSSNASSS